MLLIDKHRPTQKSQFMFNKDIIGLLEHMSKDDAIPHIIFYGPEGSGKKTILKLFLKMLFDENVEKTRDVPYVVTGSGNKTIIEQVKQSDYHIAIDPKNTNFDRYLIHDIVKEYAKSGSLGIYSTKRAFKVVVINNLDNMARYAQSSLRQTIERYNEKCRFIMWCKSISNVMSPLQSRCVCIRVPAPTDGEMFAYIFKVATIEQIFLTYAAFQKIVENANGNVKQALWDLEFGKYSYSSSTDYKKSLDNLTKLVLQMNLRNLPQIRRIIENLMITNFSETTIIKDIVDYLCLHKDITDQSKAKIIEQGATFECQMVKGRREIMQFDALIQTVWEILLDDKNVMKKYGDDD